MRTPSEKKTHQQDDGQRLGQYLYELTDAGFHCRRLIRHLAQFHASREVLLQACEFTFKGLAQYQNVAAIAHGHRQADGVRAHITHARRRRIVEATVDVGHVANTERAVPHANREIADLLHGFEIA